ncbi:MAG TPA: protein kinase, partial [Pirellulales bacterium]|nr:protein kinase [Pirellulales bacterium]
MFSLLDDAEQTTEYRPARWIAHFELRQHLGSGQFGAVWMAHDTELDRTVAVKIPRKERLDRLEVEQFLREARAAAQLRHANILRVHEVGREGDTVYIVSDFIRGAALADWLKQEQFSSR